MERFNVNYHNFYSCIYSQFCESGIKLFESCVAEVFNTRLLFPSRDLGWWGQRNFAGRPLGDFLTLLIAILVRPPVTRKYFYYCLIFFVCCWRWWPQCYLLRWQGDVSNCLSSSVQFSGDTIGNSGALILQQYFPFLYHLDTKPVLTVWRSSGTHFSPD